MRVRFVRAADEFGDPDLVVIPGSKTTVDDLIWLRSQGLAERIIDARDAGTPLIGICAGFQMLGRELRDPDGVESNQAVATGLGLLPASTTFHADKVTNQVKSRVVAGRGMLSSCQGAELSAYEIHMGVSADESTESPFLVERRSGESVASPDGALDDDGLTLGTYMHGLFHNPPIRRSVLEFAARRRGLTLPPTPGGIDPDVEYDKLAAFVRSHLDVDHIRRAMGFNA